MAIALRDLVAKFGPIFQDHQLHVLDVMPEIGGGFDVDLSAGILRLRDTGRECRVQVIGSDAPGSWMWGWANRSFPPHLLELARAAHDFGTRYEIEALVTPAFDLPAWHHAEVLTGLNLAAVACGLTRAPGLYCAHDRKRDMRLYLALVEDELREPAGDLLLRIALRYPRILMLASYPPDQGGVPIDSWSDGLEAYADELGVTCERDGDRFVLRHGERTATASWNGSSLSIETMT